MQRAMQPTAQADRFFQVSLLLLVATGYAALLATGRLDRATSLIAGASLLARAWIIFRRWILLSDRAVWILTIAYIGFYPFDFLYLSGSFLGATVRLVVFLAVLKLLTARTGRDYFYLGLIALLELLAAAVLTADAGFLGFLAFFLIFAVAARASYEIRSQSAVHAVAAGKLGPRLAALSGVLAAAIMALSLGLFFVVPRVAVAYLAKLPPSGESVLGFSDEVTLGTTGRVNKSSMTILRAKVLEGRARGNFKWRGGALQHFDGIRWSNRPSRPHVLESPPGREILVAQAQQLGRLGSRIRYRVTRSPIDTDELFVAGIPEQVSGEFSRLELSETDAFAVPRSRWKILVYEALSFVDPERPPELRTSVTDARYSPAIYPLYLQLPPLDPRIPRLARFITEAQVSPYWRSAAIEHYLQTEFGYTLDLPSERPEDPLADFLFRRRKGHCEYFASAMTVMLRSIGIPSRLVTGFQSGVYNPVSDSYTVRASDAHTWVEAYMSGFGWVTFDPTPPDPRPAQAGLLSKLSLLVDAFETYWNDWIVQYDINRQVMLARSVQNRWYTASYETSLGWDRLRQQLTARWQAWKQRPAPVFRAALAAILGAFAIWMLVRSWPALLAMIAARRIARGRGDADDCALLYARALELMKRRGFERAPWQTPEEFASIVTPPNRRQRLHQVTNAYYRARFGRDSESARRLPALVRALETLP